MEVTFALICADREGLPIRMKRLYWGLLSATLPAYLLCFSFGSQVAEYLAI
jgi:hypothetical protein